MEIKYTAALQRIRQACNLGLPSRSIIPLVMREIKTLIPSACVQFTWSSKDGRLTNFWSDTFLPRRTAWIILHRSRYEADVGVNFRDLVMFGELTGNARRWWASGFEQSTTYQAVFEPYGYKWFLDGVVRDAQRPYGCVALLRRCDDPDFTAAEEALLARVLPYLVHAIRGDAGKPTLFAPAGHSAMLVCSAEGEVLEWSDRAHRLAAYAMLEEINCDERIGRGDFERLQAGLVEVVLELGRQLDAVDGDCPMPEVVRRNGWGEFAFRGYRLSSRLGLGAERIGVLIEQFVPMEVQLLDRVNRLDLSPRQKEIAMHCARGLSNSEIASRLGMSPHTLKDHFKAIYQRLSINSQRELVAVIEPHPLAHPPPQGDVPLRLLA
jgi:DNA-binding CsgD family transcriptional regulator